jgi:glycosyltransferase AglD
VFKTKKSLKFRIISILSALAIIFILIYSVGLEDFYRVILYASPAGLVFAIIIYSLSWILRTTRLERMCKNVGSNIGYWDLFKLYISGNALNVILPAKLGDAAVICYLKMRGIGIGMAAAIAVQCRILDVLALVILTLPSAILLFRETPPEWIKFMLMASILIVSLPLGIILLSRFSNLNGLLNRNLKLQMKKGYLHLFAEKAEDAYLGYLKIATKKRLFAVTLLLSLFIWLLDILTCYEVSLAVGVKVPTLLVILAVSLANVGKSAPATPGSIGIYESILAAVLTLFGVPMRLAVPIAILDHAIKNAFTLALGVPATMNQGLDLCELDRRSEAQEH